jgi:hypothetical protein
MYNESLPLDIVERLTSEFTRAVYYVMYHIARVL